MCNLTCDIYLKDNHTVPLLCIRSLIHSFSIRIPSLKRCEVSFCIFVENFYKQPMKDCIFWHKFTRTTKISLSSSYLRNVQESFQNGEAYLQSILGSFLAKKKQTKKLGTWVYSRWLGGGII